MELHPKSVEFHDPAVEQTHATPPYPLGPTITSEGTNLVSSPIRRMGSVLTARGSVVAGANYLVNPRSIVMLHYDDAIKGQAAIH